MDLIDRQAAIDAVEFGITYAKAFNKSTGEVKELFKEGNKALNEAVERLKELPSAQPEWKKGKWIPIVKGERGYSAGDFRCSVCGDPCKCYHLTNYCPNCGAKMEAKENEND